MEIPTFDDVLAARERIAPYVHKTPVMTSSYLNGLSGAEIFFKCENLQKVGAFKARGACNAVFGLDEISAVKGVATHSSGNHAGALSYAAARRGIDATVVMPHTAPETKKAAVRSYGGRILECEPTQAAREAMLDEVIAETGADLVHPYDDARVITGQATCALELLQEIDGLDAIVAPVGGGGLVSGTCLTLAQQSPHTRIYAAEPASADDAHRSLRAGEIVLRDGQHSVADGLNTNLKPLTWHFVRNFVEDILLVSETEILDAMYLTWQRMKIIIEPSSAVPLAAILKHPEQFQGQRVGVIITGGNVELQACPGCPQLGGS
ncbi:MAG: pyridoxal-phosphate dependent enzyme [Gammaproteobacteria bacterium]|nr:pyridoxal-phosphate dependent enzyme [Gammaproteobacteria bacterium]